jgi:O-methyltransferase involved in polyketide biosynthesis
VAETLLITLYIRAMESQRPDALIEDDKAVALVREMDYDFSRVKQIKMDEDDKVAIILRTREFDCRTRDFLARNPESRVVHIGCGLDARFERVDNGQVEWYDLDLPDVIELRRQFLGGGGQRYHLLGGSDEQLAVHSQQIRRALSLGAETRPRPRTVGRWHPPVGRMVPF